MNLPVSRNDAYKARSRPWAVIKVTGKSTLLHLPLFGRVLLYLWRIIRYVVKTAKWQVYFLMDPTIRSIRKLGIHPNRVLWVSPTDIVYCAMQEFSLHYFKGRVMDGDWDSSRKKFEDLDIYEAIKKVCIEGHDWSETIFYQRFELLVESGDLVWGCRTVEDINRRCAKVGSLYRSIRNDGYKSLDQLRHENWLENALDDEVGIAIGREGDLLFSDGAHRLACAKLIGVDKIPVQVSVRHPEWIALRKELLTYAKERGGKLSQPALHPDLQDIPANQDCKEQFDIIQEHVLARCGNLLDLTAHLGYFCHRFEENGFDCFAVENSPRELYLLRKLKAAGKKRFEILAKDELECQKIKTHFDVVLALNVPDLLKTKESFDSLIDLLHNLRVGELFFAPHLPGEPELHNAYRNPSEPEFVKLIQDSAGLKYVDMLGRSRDGRTLYRLR